MKHSAFTPKEYARLKRRTYRVSQENPKVRKNMITAGKYFGTNVGGANTSLASRIACSTSNRKRFIKVTLPKLKFMEEDKP